MRLQMMRLARVVLGLVLHAIALCSAADPVDASAMAWQDAKLLAHLDQAWRQDIARDPTLATTLGVGGTYATWTPVSDRRDTEDEQRAQKALALLPRVVEFAALSPDGKLSYLVYERTLRDRIRAVEYRRNTYFFTRNTSDPYLDIPQLLISSHRIESVQDARNYIARLRGLQRLLQDALDATMRREHRGIILPAFNFQDIARNSRQLIAGRPCDEGTADQSLWADFQQKVTAAPLTEQVRKALLEDARRTIRDSLCPSYAKFAARISAMGEGRTQVDGLWSLPNGEQLYRDAIALHTSLDVDLEELHQTGLREVERIEGELFTLMRRLGYTGSVREFFESMRRDPRFLLPQSEEGRRAYLTRVQEIIERTQRNLPTLFSTIPSQPLVVRAVEPARESSLGNAAFYEPPPGGVGPGVFYIGLARMAERPIWEIEAVTYHEGVPGHHLQVTLASELQGLPEFRRRYRNGAYQEGWALYAESLGKELGGYTDDYSLAARYQLELLRAVRVVVETGFHYKRWSWERSAAYLAEHQGLQVEAAKSQMTRYIIWPGQGVSYKVGELEIRRLRRQAEDALGSRFDARGFHAVILDKGPLPLPLLQQLVSEWIQSK